MYKVKTDSNDNHNIIHGSYCSLTLKTNSCIDRSYACNLIDGRNNVKQMIDQVMACSILAWPIYAVYKLLQAHQVTDVVPSQGNWC